MKINKNEVTENMIGVLENSGYYPSTRAVEKIAAEWLENKHDLIDLLSRHPQWNAERLAVVLDEGWERPTNPDASHAFFRWLRNRYELHHINFAEVQARTAEALRATTEGSAIVSPELAEAINDIIAKHRPDIRYRVTAGGKVSRAVSKMCALIGVDKLDNFNREFARFGDASSATSVTRPTLISVNPVDYLTMSYGNGWNSCHDITDRDDPGCYSAGTLSYMMDASSVVCFTVKSQSDVWEFTGKNKIQRNMIHLSPAGDVIVQSRVYPQENDGAADLYTAWRAVVQAVVAACKQEPNLWTVKKGTAAACDVIETAQMTCHYPDYKYFQNVNVSRIKARDTEAIRIRVGHAAICPECGDTHDNEKNICCSECKAYYSDYCRECGEGIDTDSDYDAFYCEAADAWFCCSACAERAGYVYCNDVNEYVHENDVYFDEYREEYFADTSDMVETEDGRYYQNYENAEADGYIETADGRYYKDHEVFYCDECNQYHHIDDLKEVDGEIMCADCAYDKIRELLDDNTPDAYSGFSDKGTRIDIENPERSYIVYYYSNESVLVVTLEGYYYLSAYIWKYGHLPVDEVTFDTFTLNPWKAKKIQISAGIYPPADTDALPWVA